MDISLLIVMPEANFLHHCYPMTKVQGMVFHLLGICHSFVNFANHTYIFGHESRAEWLFDEL